MHFLVYGAGALGQALGCLLAAAGHEVVLVLRQRYIEAMRAGGLRVTGIFGEYRTAPGQLALWPDLQGRNGERFDYVLLTTKTYDTAFAVAEIAALAGCRCPVVSLQNGCGNLEQLIAVVGTERSLAGRVITGFEIEAPGTVRITVSADRVHIGGSERGAIPAAAANLAAVLDRAGLPSLAVTDVHQSLYAKLLYNCALNPLGAVLGVHYGALAESASARTRARRGRRARRIWPKRWAASPSGWKSSRGKCPARNRRPACGHAVIYEASDLNPDSSS